MTEGPKLLVEWSSPWQEFRTAVGPAFGRSPAALAGETPIGLFPLRGILLSWGAEAILLAVKPVPGPPPAEGLKSSLTPPTLSKNAIVAPPPETFRELNRATPGLASAVVAPPPANVSANRRQMTGLSTVIVVPSPSDVPRDQSDSVVAMTRPIVQPSPSDVQRDPPPL